MLSHWCLISSFSFSSLRKKIIQLPQINKKIYTTWRHSLNRRCQQKCVSRSYSWSSFYLIIARNINNPPSTFTADAIHTLYTSFGEQMTANQHIIEWQTIKMYLDFFPPDCWNDVQTTPDEENVSFFFQRANNCLFFVLLLDTIS